MTRPSAEQQVETAFAGAERAEVLRALGEYGTLAHEPEVDRVRWVIVHCAGGSLERVRALVTMAKTDYRDVLVADPGYHRLLERSDLRPLPEMDTAPLLLPLWKQLIGLLEQLPEEDWSRQTVAATWRVRDVAAHLLDGDLRKIAAYRDGHLPVPDRPITSDRDLGDLVNALNASGVTWAARLSPRLITDLLRMTGPWVADLLGAIPRDARSVFSVSWAGESESPQWMDTGREYTERWHHQMQIRDAVDARLLLGPSWFVPLLEFSLRALPRAYQQVEAPEGTMVSIELHGATVGAWSIRREEDGWRVLRGRPDAPDALLRTDADVAWRLFYNALDPLDLRARIDASGPDHLVAPLLTARSVIL